MQSTSKVAVIALSIFAPLACAQGSAPQGVAGGGSPDGGPAPTCSPAPWSKSFSVTATGLGLHSHAEIVNVEVGPRGDLIVIGVFEGVTNLGAGALIASEGPRLFVADFDCAGEVQWARSLGVWSTEGEGQLSVGNAAVDADGEIFIAGAATVPVSATIDFGVGPLPAGPFALKLDASGKTLWHKAYGSTDDVHIQGVAVTPAGDSYWTGTSNHGFSFGGAPLTGYVAFQLDPAGDHVWSKSIGGDPGSSTGFATLVDALDAQGHLVLCGGTINTDTPAIDLGGGPLENGLFVGALDGAGNHLWSKSFTPTGAVAWGSECGRVTQGPQGSLLISGSYYVYPETATSAVAIGFAGVPVALPGSAGSDSSASLVFARLGPTGDYVSATLPGGDITDVPGGVAGVAGDHLVATGLFLDPLDFGGAQLTDPTPDRLQMFLAELGDKGSPASAHVYETGGVVSNVVVDGSGMPVVGGSYSGTPDFGSGPLPGGTAAAFLAKIAP